LYDYLSIFSFDIFCQQDMNGIYNYVPKAQQVAFDRGNLVPEKAIFRSVTVYNKNLSSQYNLNAQIEKVQDKSQF
jgi:hypothetical protein